MDFPAPVSAGSVDPDTPVMLVRDLHHYLTIQRDHHAAGYAMSFHEAVHGEAVYGRLAELTLLDQESDRA